MLQVLCAGLDPVLLRTRQSMLQQAGFVTEVAIGAQAAVAAFTGRRFDVVVLCHTLTDQERHFLQVKLSELAPWARVVNLDYAETSPNYSPQLFPKNGSRQLILYISRRLGADVAASAKACSKPAQIREYRRAHHPPNRATINYFHVRLGNERGRVQMAYPWQVYSRGIFSTGLLESNSTPIDC